jgi:hypothetical protein
MLGIALLAVLHQSSAGAAPTCTKTWDGGAGTTKWNDSANWNPNGVPTSSDFVCVTGAGSILLQGTASTIQGIDDPDTTVTANAGLTLTDTSGNGSKPSSLSGGTFAGTGTITVSNATTLNWTNGSLTGTGNLLVASGGTLGADTTLNYLFLYGGRTLTNNGTVTVSGTNYLYYNDCSVAGAFNNAGTLTFSSDAFVYDPCGGTFFPLHNTGTVQKTGGTGTSYIYVTMDNPGTISVQTGTLDLLAAFNQFNSGTSTLTGGTYILKTTLRFASANVVTNQASITLDGTNARIRDLNNVDGLANFAANSGSLTVKNGKSLSVKPFTNSGTVVVGAGTNSTLTASGAGYTQTAGSTSLTDATSKLVTSGASGNVTVNGGTLSGIGTVQTASGDTLTNAATVSPGLSPGTLTVNAKYTQTAAGQLPIEVGGANAGQFDVLASSGAATLNGKLALSTVNGFDPQVGQTFAVMTFPSRTGTFSTVTGTDLGGGKFFDVQYNATNVTLVVMQPVPVVTGYNPVAQKVGKTFQILGSGFTGTFQVAMAKAGGGTVNAAFTVDSDVQITATVPNLAITGTVSVTNGGGTGVGPVFKVKPTLKSFDPTGGPVGTVVTITGKAFTGATKVQFNGVNASFTVVSYTKITATVPAGATTGPITVITPGGKAKSKTNFIVT